MSVYNKTIGLFTTDRTSEKSSEMQLLVLLLADHIIIYIVYTLRVIRTSWDSAIKILN